MAAQLTAHGYRYYAGFSTEFVSDVFDLLKASAADVVLDPWNGSGTTTLVGARRGIETLGLDINPVMVVVARGRFFHEGQASEAVKRAKDACQPTSKRLTRRVDEPLAAWFQPQTAARIRLLVDQLIPEGAEKGRVVDVENLDVIDAHLLTAAFLAVRSLLKPAMTSNPTWVRERLPADRRVRATWRDIATTYLAFVSALSNLHPAGDFSTASDLPSDAAARPDSTAEDHPSTVGDGASVDCSNVDRPLTPSLTVARGRSHIVTADLTDAAELVRLKEDGKMPVAASPTLVVGSPPYCTRLDYAAATRPELALLGLDSAAQRVLRRKMLGTTTVEASEPRRTRWSPAADALLADVSAHTSRASSTYYRKWLAQYLDGYLSSLTNVAALVDTDATIALVVQDSYYKDHHIDLAAITTEFAASLGWLPVGRFDFSAPRSMARINKKIRPYRDSFESTETLLVFAASDERSS